MRTLVLISILLNFGLVLAVGYGWKTSQTKPVASTSSTSVEEQSESENVKSSAKRAAKKTVSETAMAKPNFHWRDVESADYKTYIENLRRIRCPETTIADIIMMDVNKHFRNRLAPLRQGHDTTFRFWENDYGGNRNSPYAKAWQEAEKEKSKLLKELLGANYREEMAKASGWDMEPKDPFFKNMSKEDRERMGEIQEKFNDMRNEVYRRTRGGMQDEEDTAELKKIEQDQLAELSQIFSPEELFEYQLRTSQTVQSMKWNDLQGFDATEEEFRAIAKVKLAREAAGDFQTPNHTELANEAQKQDQELKKLLGEERYKEYKQNADWEYRNLKKLVEKNGGDKEIAQQIHGMKDDVRQATRKIRDNRSLSREERDQKLLELRATVDQTLTEALGERGFKAFKRNAYWIREIDQGIKKSQ